jgi:ABC-type phosphate transport system auxiliary subunit
MMWTMTKTSCWVLCIDLLLVAWRFLMYSPSPIVRANVQMHQASSMSVTQKLIQSASVVDLHHNEMTTIDKWSTLETIRILIYSSRLDFNDGMDFTSICELKKEVSEIGHVVSNIPQGNHTGTHLCEKATKACLTKCILL